MAGIGKLQFKKTFLYTLIVSVLISAALGIYVILAARHDEWTERVLATAATVAGGSVCGLACGALLESRAAARGTRPASFAGSVMVVFPTGGMLLAGAASALTLAVIWLKIDAHAVWKLMFALIIFAVACAHLSLLFLARLIHSYQWIFAGAIIIILALASALVAMVYGDFKESEMTRILAVLAVLAGAVTLLVPIFHRLSVGKHVATDPAERAASIDAEIAQLKARILELERLKVA